MKAVGIRIRIEPELRDAFMHACRNQDLPAAQVIRSFIRDYVRQCHDSNDTVTKSLKGTSKITNKN